MYKYRPFSSRDSDAVRELVRLAFPNFLEGKYWNWKYLHNSNFDPSLVAVAEDNGEVIGCSHWLQQNFKIGENLTIGSLLTCDLAVKPEHRGRGIAKRLLLQRRTRETFKSRGIVVNYDFADPRLAGQLYTPLMGYMKVGLSTKKYSKILSWRRLVDFINKEETEQILIRRFPKIRKLDLAICFKTRSAPPLVIRFLNGKVEASEEDRSDTHIRVKGDLRTLISIFAAARAKTRLLGAILTRKIRIEGKLSKLVEVYQNFSLLKTVLRAVVAQEQVLFSSEVSKYRIRTYEDGDEIGIVQLFNKTYSNYGGFVSRTPEYWRWCCLQRPNVSSEGVFVAVEKKSGNIVGYSVAGKAGSIWEFCCDPERNAEEIASLLLDGTKRYLEMTGASSMIFNAPKEDLVMAQVCRELGFETLPSPRMFLSVLNFHKLVVSLAEINKKRLKGNFNETVLVKLKDAPFWVRDTVLIRIGQDEVFVDDTIQPYTVLLETDFVTFSSLLFGILNPTDALLQMKVKIRPLWKTVTLLRLLSSLQINSKWFFPSSDYG